MKKQKWYITWCKDWRITISIVVNAICGEKNLKLSVYIGPVVRLNIHYAIVNRIYNVCSSNMMAPEINWDNAYYIIGFRQSDGLLSKTSLLQVVLYSWLLTNSNAHTNEILVTSFTTTSRNPIRQYNSFLTNRWVNYRNYFFYQFYVRYLN